MKVGSGGAGARPIDGHPVVGSGGRAVMVVLVAAALVTGCGGGAGDGEADLAVDDTGDGAGSLAVVEMSDEELVAIADGVRDVVPVDRRGSVLAELGGPDAFVITVDEVDGVVSRFESWSYFWAGTQIDFVDGELLWDVEIDVLPDGSWLPLMYDPLEFSMLAGRADVVAVLGEVELSRVVADVDLEVEGAELWAGEQLLLAFVDDQLVYVETFPLAPGGQEVAG